MQNLRHYDALLIVSFGGPEGPDQVMPFLENVLRGRNVPKERMEEVAEHYHHFGGVSPINGQVRDLIAALEPALAARGIDLPVYWGNRNWHPMLADTMATMADDGRTRALAYVTSAFSSYSGCRQYRENIETARAAVGDRAPEVDKIRVFFNHPKFVTAAAERVADTLAELPDHMRAKARLVYTAHSIPNSMADSSRYVEQLTEAARLVTEQLGPHQWDLVFQSRSGPPSVPWLEPDVNDHLRALAEAGEGGPVVLVPLGFVSDHMEVMFDLDVEAARTAAEVGIELRRAPAVGTHPLFVDMICDLVVERLDGSTPVAIGELAPSHDVCPADCCPAPTRPRRPDGIR